MTLLIALCRWFQKGDSAGERYDYSWEKLRHWVPAPFLQAREGTFTGKYQAQGRVQACIYFTFFVMRSFVIKSMSGSFKDFTANKFHVNQGCVSASLCNSLLNARLTFGLASSGQLLDKTHPAVVQQCTGVGPQSSWLSDYTPFPMESSYTQLQLSLQFCQHSRAGRSHRVKEVKDNIPIWCLLKIRKGFSNQLIWESLYKLYCSSKSMLPLSYIFIHTSCFSFIHSGLVRPVSAQIFILCWHITAHNILADREREYRDTSCWHFNCRIFSLGCHNVSATLPKLIKAQGRFESHNCVWIDSSLSCLCPELQLVTKSCWAAALPQAALLPGL